MKHTTIALFVPHCGCTHQCSFCNQKSISGKSKMLTQDDITFAVKTALENPDIKNAEIAFFGGSFTAIERNYMLSLLERADEYIDGEKICGIRISTRPDCIDEEICTLLKNHHVRAVELGAQSMDDTVLKMNRRGHTSLDVENAVKMLKSFGFETGLQMMTGLYGSSEEESLETGRKIIALRPDTVRIYPTVVLENTFLASLMRSGEYKPQSVDEAADICAQLLMMFYENGIKVIRTGLHSGGGVEEGYLGGAFHPAFKEICESRIYLKRIKDELIKLKNPEKAHIFVPKGALSQALGQKRENIKKLSDFGTECTVSENHELEKYQVLVKEISYDT